MDAKTLGELFDRHAAALTLYARQWCGSAEDVVQEAYVRLARQGAVAGPAGPWLFRTVRNAAIDAGRAEARRRRHEAEAARRPRFEPTHAGLDGDDVADALARLPAEEREAITLHLWGGLSFADAAPVMGASASSVHRWYQQGLARLRERMSAAKGEP